MSAIKLNYVGCDVLLHNEEGAYIQRCEIEYYDKRRYHMMLRGGVPEALANDEKCSLLILTEPAPREYKGIVQKNSLERYLLLYRGKTKENRLTDRFKVDFAGQILSLIRHEEIYDLHNPVKATVINISRSGLRIATLANALRAGDRIQLMVNFEDSEKRMLAIVTNQQDREENISEYGCALIVDKS